MSPYQSLINLSTKLGCKVLINEPLKKYTSFKIGGPADLIVYVNNEKNLIEILTHIYEYEIPFFTFGNGSNLLVSDEGYRGVIICLDGDLKCIRKENDTLITCGAGAPLGKACVFAMKNELSGLEFAWGIPGTCGGALFMNAGAYGKDISNVIFKANHVTPDGKTCTLRQDDMNLSYRKSLYSDNPFIITSISISLDKGIYEDIKLNMRQIVLKRKNKQPLEYPSAGSIFKRPVGGYYAGELIENCNLKGTAIGRAMVSTKHSGFIINTGNATAEDVSNLIKLIKEKVYNKTGIMLECEIKTLGNISI